ncbi:hypothetical protein BHS08_22255 [Myxococcus xanthus]|nr:hypothetical protein BHS08_22255 [Myxococcus xanthus]
MLARTKYQKFSHLILSRERRLMFSGMLGRGLELLVRVRGWGSLLCLQSSVMISGKMLMR